MLEAIFISVFIIAFVFLVFILNLKNNKKEDLEYIEFVPDLDYLFSQEAAFKFLDEINGYLGRYAKLVLKYRLSSEGIKFVIGANHKTIKKVQNALRSLDINLDISKIDYSILSYKAYRGYSLFKILKIKKHFISNKDLSENQLKSLVITCSNLGLDEIIDLDITLRPYKSIYLSFIRSRILSNKKIIKFRSRSLNFITYTLLGLLKLLATVLQFISIRPNYRPQVLNNFKTQYYSKLDAKYYKTVIKISVFSKYKYRLIDIDHDIKALFKNYKNYYLKDLYFKKFNNYLPILFFSKNIISQTGIANFYHLVQFNRPDSYYFLNHFKKLDLSLDRRQDYLNKNYDLVLGKWFDSRDSLEVVMTKEDRKQHFLICGATGSGKSTLMYNMVQKDISNKKSLALIDPHGDLAERILNNMSAQDKQHLIYFNPMAQNQTFSINLLERYTVPGTKEYEVETELIIENLISVFTKIFSSEQLIGHRIEYILRNALKTALILERPTLLNVFDLINNPNYLNSMLPNIKDPSLLNFWNNEFKKAGDYQKVKMSFGVTTKIGRFLFSDIAKNVFGSSRPGLNFYELMNSHNVLIFKIAKGEIGEENSSIFGTLILTKIQLSILARSKIQFNARHDFYLYVDEFQNFASLNFTQMLSEARKFKLYLIIAEQSLSQQDPLVTATMLANVGTIATFKTPSPFDQKLLIRYFEPFLKSSDLRHIPVLNFYLTSIYRSNDSPINVSIEM